MENKTYNKNRKFSEEDALRKTLFRCDRKDLIEMYLSAKHQLDNLRAITKEANELYKIIITDADNDNVILVKNFSNKDEAELRYQKLSNWLNAQKVKVTLVTVD